MALFVLVSNINAEWHTRLISNIDNRGLSILVQVRHNAGRRFCLLLLSITFSRMLHLNRTYQQGFERQCIAYADTQNGKLVV